MRLLLTEEQVSGALRYFDAPAERMAFGVACPGKVDGAWELLEVRFLDDETDYEYRGRLGVVVAEHVRPDVLRWAHGLGGALVEAHSHWHRGPVGLSRTDTDGLRASAPQLLWRLPGRPYLALAVGPDSVDAVCWTASGPQALDAVVIAGRPLRPTGVGLRRLARPASSEGGSR